MLSMPRRFSRAVLAGAIAGALLHAGAAQAQVSDDVIRIGFITDMSGVYSGPDGPGGAEAIKMAIEEMGGEINGKKIELLTADHQNKADIASAKAREWFDRWPKQAYWTAIESWCERPEDVIEFTMRRLPTAD